MVKLEDVKVNSQICGIHGTEVVTVFQVSPVGDDALTVYYKNDQGQMREQLLFLSNETRL